MAKVNWPDEISNRSGDCFDEAALWHARWRDSKTFSAPSPEEIGRWTDWIQLEENKRAYDAIAKSSQLRHQLTASVSPGAQDSFNSTHERPRLSQRLRRAYLVTAAATLLMSFFGLYLYNLFTRSAEQLRWVTTGEGEKETFTLEDGSRVWLGSGSQISMRFTSHARTIQLLRGEALFDVARNLSRPFIVFAGSGSITAIGTKFSVRRTLDRVTVRVAEGAVKVDPLEIAQVLRADSEHQQTRWAEAKLATGDEVTYSGNQKRGPVESADPRAAAAWLDGRREYRHEPLTYVVADISRCFGKHIEVGDVDVGELQFTGRVYEAQVDEWLRALETIFPVEISGTNTDDVIIRRRNEPAGEQVLPTSR